jgi:uncharacterized protein DUF6551
VKAPQKTPPGVAKITKGSRKKPFTRLIPAQDIKVDPRVQRQLIPARVKALAAALDLDALGILLVSKREKGDYYVLDGQHRIAALMAEDLGEWEVNCQVYEGLTLAQEAEFFRRHNNTRPITAFDDYDKGLTAEDPEVLAIDAILKKHGFKMAGSARDGVVSAVVTVRNIYRQDEGKTLDTTLGIIVSAWGQRAASVEKPILGGMSRVVSIYGSELERKVLVSKLQKSTGAASGVLGKARALKDMYPDSLEVLVAKVIVGIYNTGRRGGRLADI